MTTLVALLVAMGLVSAQAPARDPGAVAPPPRVGTASVSGAVTDESNRPVRRARVTASGPSGLKLSAITDDSGHFVISALPAGRFTFTAQKAGSPSASYGANRPNRPGAGMLLADGQHVTGIALTLARGGVLSGIVVDESGRPMPGDYRIAVTTDLVPEDLADGNALQRLMLGAVAVTIGPGERKVFDIRTVQ